MSPAPRDASGPQAARSESRGLSRSSIGAVEVGRGGNRKGPGTSRQGVVWTHGHLVGPIANNKARLPLSCSFLPRAWKIVTRGKTWPGVVYLKVGNDTLAKLDHPYASAAEAPAKNVYTRHRGHSEALGAELPWV